MKIYRNIYIAVFIFIFSIVVFSCTLFNFELGKVSNNDELVTVTIDKGSISDIAKTLKDNNLIKSEVFFKAYITITGNTNLMAATYELSENMGAKKIIDILSKGTSTTSINITFKEGLNMRKIANIIEDKSNNTTEDVYNLLNDYDYINSLIEKYWFLTNDILDSGIYYSLEGYLYPNTYSFNSNKVSVKEIFSSMLEETDKQLSKYKSIINNNSMSIHELLTMASMVELESTTTEDRKTVASVFYNRIASSMSLGSDVTTYYAAKIDMGQRDLYSSELSECNNYNTRCATYKGLPIGPICNPSIDSIEAVLEPNKTNYYYFVADKNGDIYFSKSSIEQTNTINKLKKEGLWYEY